jgi:N-acetylmuramoyl-L-alanine amidase
VELSGAANFSVNRLKDPDRLYIDFTESTLAPEGRVNQTVGDGVVTAIRAGQHDRATSRVVIDLGASVEYKIFRLSEPARVVVDIYPRGTAPAALSPAAPSSPNPSIHVQPGADPDSEQTLVAKLSERKAAYMMQIQAARAREQAHASPRAQNAAPSVPAPARQAAAAPAAPAAPVAPVAPAPKQREISAAHEAQASAPAAPAPVARATRPAPARNAATHPNQLKLYKIVLDAGHGGRDPGALGPGGLREKDIVLDVAMRLKKILEARGGYEVVLTRSDDRYLDLEQRTVIANREQADLFVSVHVNANRTRSLSGMETYFLNFTDDEENMEVAARENKISLKRMHEARDEVGAMLASLQLQNKRDHSMALANYIQEEMFGHVSKKYGHVRDHGVKSALFYVLFGARMPSVLVEVSYITNAEEARRLTDSAYRDRLAQGIASGIDRYFAETPAETPNVAMR